MFGNKEAKLAEKQRKEEEKVYQILEKYGMDDLTDPRDIECVKEIARQMTGKGLMELGSALGGANEKDYLRMISDYQKILIQQNFILIRLLSK